MTIKSGANKNDIYKLKTMVAAGVQPPEIAKGLRLEEKVVDNLIKSLNLKVVRVAERPRPAPEPFAGARENTKPSTASTASTKPPLSKKSTLVKGDIPNDKE